MLWVVNVHVVGVEVCGESKVVEMKCEVVSAAARDVVGLHFPPLGVQGYLAHT